MKGPHLCLLLLLSLVGLSLQEYFQDWTPINDPWGLHVHDLHDLANETITWYNGQHNTNFVLVNLTGGFAKIYIPRGHAEFHYALNMDARPEPQCPPSNYRALVDVLSFGLMGDTEYRVFEKGTFVKPPGSN